MKAKTSLFFAIVYTLFSCVPCFGQGKCIDIFGHQVRAEAEASVPEELLNLSLNKDQLLRMEPQILELTSALIEANYKELLRANELSDQRRLLTPDGEWIRTISPESFDPGRITISDFRPEHKFPEVWVFPKQWSGSFEIRTNGTVAFLAKTHWYREKGKVKRYKAVYKDSQGRIQVVDQGTTILNSMPASMPVARLMGEAEKKLWRSGEFQKTSKYGFKIHFAPHSYKMSPTDVPVVFNIPRATLIELYKKGALEINTYEFLEPGVGIGLTKLGLEYELVFFGAEAIRVLEPFLQKALAE